VRFDLNETHLMIQDTARKFAEQVLAPKAALRDEMEEFPYEEVRQLGELGFMGMMVEEKYGGAGLDTVSYVLALEEISKVDASCGVIMSVCNSLVCFGLEKWGTEEQKQKYLIPVASGKLLGAFALSEPDAGSDATHLKTTASADGDYYVLNGTKNFITNGANAEIILVMAVTDRTKGSHGISTFIVEKGTAGLTVAKKEKKLGIRSSDTASLSFENCRVPKSNIIGEEGFGFKFAMITLDGGRIGIAAQALGIAEASFEAARAYSKQRTAFGSTLSGFQAIQFKLADMATKIEAARMLTLESALEKDAGRPFSHLSARAKLFASKVAVECALDAIQIHGGYGYIKDFPVERYLRDAKITEIYEGTSEIQRLVIARQLLKT
jgi:alkylation response protein AidB-like acyl-CoA dehydrogenase